MQHGRGKVIEFFFPFLVQQVLPERFGGKPLHSRIRILCFIPTSVRNLETKTLAVKDTWSKRCNKRIFFTSGPNTSFPTIGLNIREGLEGLTTKTMTSLQYIYDHHLNEADWFLKADDDTYVIMENLR